VRELLAHLAAIRELVFVIDGSEVGSGCITLQTSLLYVKRALPITWLVVKGRKGHLAEQVHRSDRCDWSLFRLGLALLDHFLNELLPIPVSFNLLEKNCVR
jgi:hypothetical protein